MKQEEKEYLISEIFDSLPKKTFSFRERKEKNAIINGILKAIYAKIYGEDIRVVNLGTNDDNDQLISFLADRDHHEIAVWIQGIPLCIPEAEDSEGGDIEPLLAMLRAAFSM